MLGKHIKNTKKAPISYHYNIRVATQIMCANSGVTGRLVLFANIGFSCCENKKNIQEKGIPGMANICHRDLKHLMAMNQLSTAVIHGSTLDCRHTWIYSRLPTYLVEANSATQSMHTNWRRTRNVTFRARDFERDRRQGTPKGTPDFNLSSAKDL